MTTRNTQFDPRDPRQQLRRPPQGGLAALADLTSRADTQGSLAGLASPAGESDPRLSLPQPTGPNVDMGGGPSTGPTDGVNPGGNMFTGGADNFSELNPPGNTVDVGFGMTPTDGGREGGRGPRDLTETIGLPVPPDEPADTSDQAIPRDGSMTPIGSTPPSDAGTGSPVGSSDYTDPLEGDHVPGTPVGDVTLDDFTALNPPGGTAMDETGGRGNPMAPPPVPTDPYGNPQFPGAGSGSGESSTPGISDAGPRPVVDDAGNVTAGPNPNEPIPIPGGFDPGPAPGDPDYDGAPPTIPVDENGDNVNLDDFTDINPPGGGDIPAEGDDAPASDVPDMPQDFGGMLEQIMQLIQQQPPQEPPQPAWTPSGPNRAPLDPVAAPQAQMPNLPPMPGLSLPQGTSGFFDSFAAPGGPIDVGNVGGVPSPGGGGQPTPGQQDDLNPPFGQGDSDPNGYNPVTGMNPIYDPPTMGGGLDTGDMAGAPVGGLPSIPTPGTVGGGGGIPQIPQWLLEIPPELRQE